MRSEPGVRSASKAPPGRLLNYAAFLLCTLIWGSTFLVIRLGNDATPPLWAATLRLAMAAVFLGLVMVLTGLRLPRGKELRVTLLYGLFVFGINFALLYYSETRISSGITAVIYATLPLTTLAFARWLGIERITFRNLAGGVIGLLGVMVIFLGDVSSQSAPLYLLMAFMGSVSAALSSAILKRGPHPPVITTNAIASAVGAVVCWVASTLAGEDHALPRTWAAWLPLLYLTFAGSVVAFVAYTWLLKQWSTTRASFTSILVPVLAIILGAVVRHEHFTRGALVGAVLVLCGLAIALPSQRPRAS